ncbi:hypothetical protein [Parashewanella tropica]|uniref:hypothetical protein n=1 Tax=Parashewanella tropica TaxID=2547970 RepID=UPI00105954A3|nr:hypothetical protein [Parashewanella tropica]
MAGPKALTQTFFHHVIQQHSYSMLSEEQLIAFANKLPAEIDPERGATLIMPVKVQSAHGWSVDKKGYRVFIDKGSVYGVKFSAYHSASSQPCSSKNEAEMLDEAYRKSVDNYRLYSKSDVTPHIKALKATKARTKSTPAKPSDDKDKSERANEQARSQTFTITTMATDPIKPEDMLKLDEEHFSDESQSSQSLCASSDSHTFQEQNSSLLSQAHTQSTSKEQQAVSSTESSLKCKPEPEPEASRLSRSDSFSDFVWVPMPEEGAPNQEGLESSTVNKTVESSGLEVAAVPTEAQAVTPVSFPPQLSSSSSEDEPVVLRGSKKKTKKKGSTGDKVTQSLDGATLREVIDGNDLFASGYMTRVSNLSDVEDKLVLATNNLIVVIGDTLMTKREINGRYSLIPTSSPKTNNCFKCWHKRALRESKQLHITILCDEKNQDSVAAVLREQKVALTEDKKNGYQYWALYGLTFSVTDAIRNLYRSLNDEEGEAKITIVGDNLDQLRAAIMHLKRKTKNVAGIYVTGDRLPMAKGFVASLGKT